MNGAVHVSLGNNTNGPHVAIICNKRSGITTRSFPFIKNKIPIMHSNNPKRIKNVGNDMNEIVCSNNR